MLVLSPKDVVYLPVGWWQPMVPLDGSFNGGCAEVFVV